MTNVREFRSASVENQLYLYGDYFCIPAGELSQDIITEKNNQNIFNLGSNFILFYLNTVKSHKLFMLSQAWISIIVLS